MVQRNLNPLTCFLCYRSAEEALSELAILKQVIVSSDWNALFSFQHLAENVFHEYMDVITEMEKPSEIPIASVLCKRGFSTQDSIKTKFINSLSKTT